MSNKSKEINEEEDEGVVVIKTKQLKDIEKKLKEKKDELETELKKCIATSEVNYEFAKYYHDKYSKASKTLREVLSLNDSLKRKVLILENKLRARGHLK